MPKELEDASLFDNSLRKPEGIVLSLAMMDNDISP
jgi:hypothetical protein